MKECFKCRRVLPLDEFYKHPKMADGYLGKCKDCTRKDVHENYCKRREQYAEYDRNRYQEPRRHEYVIAQAKRHKRLNPNKAKARELVAKAIRSGRITRDPCQFCGNPKSQAHHHDYSKPLDVIWACFKCHREKFHNQVVISNF